MLQDTKKLEAKIIQTEYGIPDKSFLVKITGEVKKYFIQS